jgi:phosphate transport system permease protein
MPNTKKTLPGHATEQNRFETSKLTLLVDRFMTVFIKFGGALVITSVLGIFVFIVLQIWPLFGPPSVSPLKSIPLPDTKYALLGVDEWGAKPFLVEPDGSLLVVDYETGETQDQSLNLGITGQVTAAFLNKREQKIILGTSNGQFVFVSPNHTSRESGGRQIIDVNPTAETPSSIGDPGMPITDIAYGDSGSSKLIVALQSDGETNRVTASLFKRKRSLMGKNKEEAAGTHDLTPMIPGRPEKILVPVTGDSVVVISESGKVSYLVLADGKFELRQSFTPFGDLANSHINVANFIFGDVSIAFASDSGENRIFSLFYPEGGKERLFGLTHEFPNLGASPVLLVSTLRNKAFLLGGGKELSLRYSTTESIRWQSRVPYPVSNAVISGKYQRLAVLDSSNTLHFFEIDDPHPDSGWKALFGKVWYEGAPGPKWDWQSTGGSDDFEPKYSLVPLIFGTLKGTLYAMLFAVPIALLAALYTSQFLDPRFRSTVKPTMEIMASLPSVVLGFLAAIYIAPLIERQVPSLLLVVVGVPIVAAFSGFFWSHLPIQIRKFIHPGWEWIVFLPLLFISAGILWYLGPAFESVAFVVTDPATGQKTADFRAWWPAVTGASYDQRNSLVVGFMMGFAVIPIIFTIAEDALSNVPKPLITASMACGASRWQTALRVVMPTASAGIFSALMIGLGRAVGETMIVVMATGNTPIMEWNIFSGMRTLSANIAVELPEAPHHATLYRTLFLGALVLFLLTFAINTVAEVLRQHLREKFKTT